MKQLDISPKKLSITQSLICLFLSILLALCSFLPIVSYDAGGDKANDEMNALFDRIRDSKKTHVRIASDFEFDIPEEVAFSFETAVRADVLLVKSVKFGIDINKLAGDDREFSPEKEKKARVLTDKWLEALKDPEDQAAFYAVTSLLGQAFDVAELFGTREDDVTYNEEIPALVVSALYSLLLLIMLLVAIWMTHILPIVSVAGAIFCIKNAIQYRTCLYQISGRTYAKVQKRLLDAIGLPVSLSLFAGVSMGLGAILIILIGIINIFIAAALARGRNYEGDYFKYVNITQICSLGASVGGLLCYCMLADLGFVREFCAALGEFLDEFFLRTAIIGNLIDGYIPNFAFLIDVALVLIFVFAGVLRIIDLSTRTCSITALKCRAELAPKTLIVGGSTIFAASLMPFVLTFLKDGILHDLDVGTQEVIRDSAETIYTMSTDVRIKLIFILIGAALIIAAGIVMKVLRKKYCPSIADLDAARMFDDTNISKDRLHC